MRSHKDLDVWKSAIELARDVYETTRSYPRDEAYGLVSQMRRAAVSIASNIAEGAARNGNREFTKFLYIAAGSASELDTQIEISKAAGIGDPIRLANLQHELQKVSRLLQGLIRAVNK